MVLCLSIDMIGSTKLGLALSHEKFREYNQAIVDQIGDRLLVSGLTKDYRLLKFTGDGWLVMVWSDEQYYSLCTLAVVMRERFQEDMRIKTSGKLTVPLLRLGIGAAQDQCVKLPDGDLDWVGDSVRRAVRVSQFCADGKSQILVEPVAKGELIRSASFTPLSTKDFKPQCDRHHRQPEDCCRAPKQEEAWEVVHILDSLKLQVEETT